MIWSEEDIARVKHLAEVEGLSGAGIASYFNNCSRSAIISLCHRKGISLKRRINQYAEVNGVVKEKRIKFKPNKAQIMIAESYVPPVEQRLSLMELKKNSCRWPLGDGPMYFFCGGEANNNLPYCEHHCAIAYNVKPEKYEPRKPRSWGSI